MCPTKLLTARTLALSAGLAVALIANSMAPADAASHAARSMRQVYLSECNAEAQAQELQGGALRGFVDDCVNARLQAGPEQIQQMRSTVCQRRATRNQVQGHDRQHYVEDCVNAPTAMTEQHYEKMLQCSRRATKEGVWATKREKFVNDCIGG